jgi:hypothetical protein
MDLGRSLKSFDKNICSPDIKRAVNIKYRVVYSKIK